MTATVESVSPAAGEDGGGTGTTAGSGGPRRSVASRILARLSSGTVQIVLIVIAVLWMIPIFGLLVSSFRSGESNSNNGWWHVFSAPSELTLANYTNLLSNQAILTSLWNTVLITVPSTVLVVLVGALAAYALTWIKFPGRDWVMVGVVGLLVVPVQLALIPIAGFYKNVGLFGTIPGIVLFHTAFGLPFAIFLLRNYFLGIPTDLLEAARMDGGSEWSIFRRVVLPIALPALASLASHSRQPSRVRAGSAWAPSSPAASATWGRSRGQFSQPPSGASSVSPASTRWRASRRSAAGSLFTARTRSPSRSRPSQTPSSSTCGRTPSGWPTTGRASGPARLYRRAAS